MKLEDILKYYPNSTQREIGEVLNVKQCTVANWRTRGVSHKKQIEIEKITNGDLKAEV